MLMSRRRVEPPISRTIGAATMLLGIIGLVLFVYADRAGNRPLRLSAVLVVTLALLVGVVLTVRRNARVTRTEPRKRS
jgi:Flp pilus assembly protein TadB